MMPPGELNYRWPDVTKLGSYLVNTFHTDKFQLTFYKQGFEPDKYIFYRQICKSE